MNSDSFLELLILIVLLCFSGFFSASETALLAIGKIKLRHMVEENKNGANILSKLLKNPNRLLGTILIGNNAVNIGASALATSLAIKYFGSSGVGIATGVMTILVIVFGEITPKTLAVKNPEKVSLKVARAISIITTILYPITEFVNFITDIILRLLGTSSSKEKPYITEEEFKVMVNVSHEEGVLEVEEKKMIYNVFEFGDSKVQDVMTPRTDVFSIDVEMSYDDIMKLFKEQQYSRMPVYEDNMDNIIGILHIKDMIQSSSVEFNLKKHMRSPFFTLELKRVAELFNEMRDNKVQMAIVLDEYGGTSGIITMEDLIEEIVGEIQDEYDVYMSEIEPISKSEFLCVGSAKIDLVNEIANINIQSENYDSIGGFVIGEMGRFPRTGESIDYQGIKFIIEKVHKNRILKLRIVK